MAMHMAIPPTVIKLKRRHEVEWLFHRIVLSVPNVQIHIGDRTHRFESASGKSLLEEALQAGVPVNYSCKRGDCGQCIGELERGEIGPVNPAQPLRVGGDIYLCNAIAQGDLEVRLPYFQELDEVSCIRSPAKIHELRPLTVDVLEIALRLPPSTRMRFLPGQFMRLTNKERTTRSYSLAAGPRDDKLLRFHVKRVDGGAFSSYLFGRAQPGDLLHIEGPQGRFFLRSGQRYAKTVFLATGTGIAPIYAMLSSLSSEQRSALGDVDVYWGNRERREEYYAEAWAALSSSAGIRYWPVYSRSPSGSARYVQDLMTHHHKRLTDAALFACGNVAMIDSARRICTELGMALDRFHSDPFTSS